MSWSYRNQFTDLIRPFCRVELNQICVLLAAMPRMQEHLHCCVLLHSQGCILVLIGLLPCDSCLHSVQSVRPFETHIMLLRLSLLPNQAMHQAFLGVSLQMLSTQAEPAQTQMSLAELAARLSEESWLLIRRKKQRPENKLLSMRS